MTSASFNQCVDDFADGLFRFSVSMLGEDAVQDVFERFWLKRHNVTPGKEKSYLFTSVHNRCIDLI